MSAARTDPQERRLIQAVVAAVSQLQKKKENVQIFAQSYREGAGLEPDAVDNKLNALRQEIAKAEEHLMWCRAVLKYHREEKKEEQERQEREEEEKLKALDKTEENFPPLPSKTKKNSELREKGN